MADVIFTCKAFAKIMMHAVKYPHCALNGILLAESDKTKDVSRNQKITVVDAIPLFHQCLHVTPMAEVALAQVDALCGGAGLRVVGYYAASDNFAHNSPDRAPADRIADKIAEVFPSALFAVVDNRKISLDLENPSLRVAQFQDGKWRMKESSHVVVDGNTLDCVSRLLKTAAFKSLVDYDNHLDDITQDWANRSVNTQIDQLMAMYS